MDGTNLRSIRYLGDDVALAAVLRARCSTLPNRRLSRRPSAAHRVSTSLPVPREEARQSAVTSRDGVKSVVD
jgi:hypothetical protein